MQCCLAYMQWYALWPVWLAEVCQHMEWITCFNGSLTRKLGMLKHKQSLSPQDNYQIAWNSQTSSNTCFSYSSTYIILYTYIYIYITVIFHIIKNTMNEHKILFHWFTIWYHYYYTWTILINHEKYHHHIPWGFTVSADRCLLVA